MIEIRKAVKADLAVLLGFEEGLITAERPFDNTLQDGKIHYYDLGSLIEAEWAEVLVAVIGDEIVGSGYAKILPAKPFQKHENYAYLGFMYVKPEFRGQGINQKIINSLMVWAKSQNLTEVRLQVYDENISAKKAYLKAGFQPHLLEMRLEIGADTAD